MGRKKTYVGTSVSRVIDDANQPDSVKKGLMRALHSNGEIVDNVLEELVNSIGLKAEKLYRFAENGNYIHGLPSGQYTVPATGWEAAVQTVLNTLEGAPVTMDYVRYGPPNSLHIGWLQLYRDHGYNHATNEIGYSPVLPGGFLVDMVVIPAYGTLDSIEPRTLEQWGVSPRAGATPTRAALSPEATKLVPFSAPFIDEGAAFESVRVTTVMYSVEGGTTGDTRDIVLDTYDENKDYIHVRYVVGGQPHYWMYEVGSGGHPSIDALFDKDATTGGHFFPFIYFRQNKVSELDSPLSESYLDNKKLLKILGMDYDTIAEGIESNPDIGDVEQAVMMFAVPANTTNEEEQSYLWDFFNGLFLAQPNELRYRYDVSADIRLKMTSVSIPAPSIVIQDTRFKMAISNRGIYKVRKAGVLGPVGSHTSDSSFIEIQTTAYTSVTLNEGPPTLEPYTIITPLSVHRYRRQISDSMYDEIQVVDLETKFFIIDGYSVIGDDDDKILLIPLDHALTEDYPIPLREALYSRSLHYVFNSVVVVKVKWYETGLFKLLMVVIAVVAISFGWGPVAAKILAATAAGAYVAAAVLIFEMLLQYIVVAIVFKLFVKAVGVKAALIIALVAAAAGMWQAIEAGSIAGAPFAKDLLSLANGLTSTVSDVMEDLVGDLMAEASAFEAYTREQLKLLESANELLNSNKNLLSPFVIFGEKPEDFYNRTVHSGNIGVVAIEAVSSFVDSKLTLPKLDETLGEVAEEGV